MDIHVLIPLLLTLAGAGSADDKNIIFRSTLPPSETSYRILFLSPTKLKSHMLAQHPLMVALANRGHKVVLLSEPSWTDRHPNVTYLDHSAQLPGPADRATFAAVHNPLHLITVLGEGLELYAKNLFSDSVVLELYKTRKEFDIIVIDELLFKALYPFVHGTTYAKFSGTTLHQHGSSTFGNPLNPAFVSSFIEEFPQPYSTWHRFKNCFLMLVHYISCRYLVPHLATTEIASRFPSLPPPHVVETNASLYLVFSDYTLDGVFPALPLTVPVAGLTLRPVKPLPKDIANFLSGDTPAVFVSMGASFGHSSQIPQAYKDVFFTVFSQLPYKFLLRFDERPKKMYKNLFIRKWFPQQDVLAHANVKACISHGGVQTVHEATHYGVPILGLPYMPEHRRMIQGLVYRGQGLVLEWSELSAQRLNASIKELIRNPSYRDKMAEASRIFKDQRESPLDRAVYWTEYVAKYRGAPHLQSPAKQLTWVEILNLDIIALIFVVVYFMLRLQMWSLRKLITWISRKWKRFEEKQKVQ